MAHSDRRAAAGSSAGLSSVAAILLVTLAIVCSLSLPTAEAAVSCPPGSFCYDSSITALSNISCVPSQYCPGDRTGAFCAKGFYCPTVTEQIECPEGSYCPPATIQPRPCSPLASCPAGSYRYLHWGALVFLLIVLPSLAFMGKGYEHLNRKKKQNSYESVSRAPTQKLAASGDVASASSLHLDRVPRMEISFKNLAATIQLNGKPKPILSDVSGHFKAGRLIAVMGPSGAGKSSLIAVLTGQVPATGGSIETRIDDALESNLLKARRLGMIGVVPQADTMLPELTPLDIITHSAQTRLPVDWTAERKAARVQETLRVLGLSHVQHTPTGNEETRGLSGGECKRVNVGIELVASPSLLILDEPTTGLDGTSANSLLSTLKSITALQTTVVAVLHQPRQEIFNKFDDLLLLAPGGRTVFFGPASMMLSYFTAVGYPCPFNTNPSDHVIDAIAGKAGPPRIEGEAKDEYEHAGFGRGSSGGASSFGVGAENGKSGANKMSAQEIQDYLVQSWSERGSTFTSEYAAASSAAAAAAHPVASSASKLKPSQSFRSTVVLPSWFALTWLYLRRGLLQIVRNLSNFQIDAFLHILAGGVIGMAFVDQNWFIGPIPPAYVQFCPEPLQRSCEQDAVRNVIDLMVTYTCMALGLVAAIIGVRSYGSELTNTARESSAGLPLSSYFLGKNLAELPSIVIYAFLYCVSFYLICSPASGFGSFFAVILLFEWVMFGIGAVSSVLLSSQSNALLCAAISALLGGLATDNDGFIKSLCWTRWAAEALFLSESRLDLLPEPVKSNTQAYLTLANKFDKDAYPKDILALVIYGTVLRILAFALMSRKFRQQK